MNDNDIWQQLERWSDGNLNHDRPHRLTQCMCTKTDSINGVRICQDGCQYGDD